MSPPSILALDVARQFGWAFAVPAAVAAWPVGLMGVRGPIDGVSYGSDCCGDPGDPRGQKFLRFARWLDRTMSSLKPGLVAVEGPIHHRTMDGMLQLGGLITKVEMICCAHRIEMLPLVSPSEVKKHFVGNGHAEKPVIMAACDRRGWRPADSDAGDALAALDWAAHRWHATKGLNRGNVCNVDC